MAAKKTKNKARKKQTKSKTASAKKTISKKSAAKKKLGISKTTPKKLASKKNPQKMPAVKKKPVSSGRGGPKRGSALKKRSHEKSWTPDGVAVSPPTELEVPPVESGDLEGLSEVESADSESVDELLEEGNSVEASVVRGVENADNADEKEVRTHEMPEDDVPGEYLDKD